jgi:predicted acyltransferase
LAYGGGSHKLPQGDLIVDNQRPDLTKTRILSIDALRGFDMLWIIGGGELFTSLAKVWKTPAAQKIDEQLSHVEWEGFRFEDLIFPLFVFIVGVVLPFSISRRLEQGQSRSKIYLHILKRTVVLILLGLILNGLLRFNWPQMRWPGVLQRIGLCYFFAALLVVHTKWRTQAIVAVAVLLLYWAAMMLIPVPDYGAGALTKEGCLSSYIDQKVVPGVLYYKYGDNEGVISTLPAVCTALLGVLAGHWLRSKRPGNIKAAGLLVAGIVSLIAGYLWGTVFPIIKIIWTSSYVLYAGGWSLLLLAFFYWIIDVHGYKKWAFFFTVIGMNPITIYFLRDLVDFDHIAGFFLAGLAQNAGSLNPLILPAGAVIIEWLFLWFLFRHRIFFKV